MKKLIFLSFIFIIPYLIYSLIVVVVDPYNYFGLFKFTSNNEKALISKKINYALWHLIEYKNAPVENILIGDSRMSRLKSDLIEQITGNKYYNFAYGGGTLEESISTFWEAEKIIDLKNVVIGVNFNNFSANNIRNRIPGAVAIMKNPLLYLTNWNVLQSTVSVAKKELLRASIQIERPSISKKDFWKQKLNNTSRRFYSNYQYPEETWIKLSKVIQYCNANNITVRFVVLPTHVALQNKIKEYGLESANKRFLSDLRKLGVVYDFDLPTELTMNKKNFSDPFHLRKTDQLCSKLIKDIFIHEKPLYAMYMKKKIPITDDAK
jgi:hypothetical protein